MLSTRIVDLPLELISKILGFYVQDLCETISCRGSHTMHYVIGLTHVCRAFRMIALHCSELWCNILVEKAEVLKHFMHYSQHRPLSIRLDGRICFLDGWDYLQLVLPVHSTRIQELDLDLPYNELKALLIGIWKDLPLLSILTLCELQNTWSQDEEDIEAVIELDAIPLPSLESLFISYAPIRFPWSSCRDLIELSLTYISPALPWSKFTDLLSNSPRLELIELYTIKFDDPIESELRIDLPRLAYLGLDSLHTSVVFALLHIITTISLARVHVEIYDEISLDEQVQLREVARHLVTLTNAGLGICLSYDNGLPSPATVFTGTFHEKLHSVTGPESVMRVAFDLSLIRHIYLTTDTCNDWSLGEYINDDLELTLGLCTSVLELTITGPMSQIRLVLQHLSLPAEEETMQLESGQLLACRKVQVIDMTLSKDPPERTNEPVDDPLESFLSSLCVYLAARTELGTKVQTVKLKGHDVGPEVSSRFKGLVGQLFIQDRKVEIENN